MPNETATRKADALRRKLVKWWPLDGSRAVNGLEVTATEDGTSIRVTALSNGAEIRTNTFSAELGAWDLYRHAKGTILTAVSDAISAYLNAADPSVASEARETAAAERQQPPVKYPDRDELARELYLRDNANQLPAQALAEWNRQTADGFENYCHNLADAAIEAFRKANP